MNLRTRVNVTSSRPYRVVGTKLKPTIEGADGKNGEGGDDHWMLVDCGSCIVHVFSAEARERYDLEGLWAPGKVLEKLNPVDQIMTIDTITVPEAKEAKEEDEDKAKDHEDEDDEEDGMMEGLEDVELDLEDMAPLEVGRREGGGITLTHADVTRTYSHFSLSTVLDDDDDGEETPPPPPPPPRELFCADELNIFISR